MSNFPDFSLEIDTSGLTCPLPLLRTKKALQGLESGQVLKVLTTDHSAAKDFQAFAKQTGHLVLLQNNQADGKCTHFIKKK